MHAARSRRAYVARAAAEPANNFLHFNGAALTGMTALTFVDKAGAAAAQQCSAVDIERMAALRAREALDMGQKSIWPEFPAPDRCAIHLAILDDGKAVFCQNGNTDL